ncbi:S15 peptidase family protein [Micromonospora deserti]|uniref:S15 peptidase family protein n=1 Tax=Micromonospora deserti TaxID=2070366 RepID=UPI0013143E78|nr:CocE/NonD family hydrolase C-terminal non-catalytic domain-containing protein [Micromonospora deserti]
MRRAGALLAAILTMSGTALVATPARAADDCSLGLATAGQVSPVGGGGYLVCSGRVASFDGTPLDVDLSIPVNVPGPLPLMVMLHGWGGSKADYESTSLAGNGRNTWHWNNAWFASHGFAVLNYTARGFGRSCGQDPAHGYTYAADPRCAGRASWTHLSDRRWEIRDTQYLTGLLVDAAIARPDQVVVTGGSYGGGQSWLLAMAQDRVLQPDGTTRSWSSPRGTPIRLAAAVPQYGWTDLAQALIDNGRAADGLSGTAADLPHQDPVGVAKQSYVDGLYAAGQITAQYAAHDPSANLPGWFAAITAGEPYQANPLVAQAIAQLEQFRSAYAMPVPPASAQVPVYAIQGLTDPLFPGIQATQMLTRLQKARPGYPVWALFGDVGHSYAGNPPEVWQTANDAANRWLHEILAGAEPTAPKVTLNPVQCADNRDVSSYSADRLANLANSVWTFRDDARVTTANTFVPGPESAGLDPILNSGCRTAAVGSDPGVATWTFRPPTAGTLVGAPVVRVTATLIGTDAELAARLFDVDPAAGTQTLITRAVLRVTGSTGLAQEVTCQLWPTGWRLPIGHQLKLELTATDTPTWRANNQPAALALSNLEVTVPLHATTPSGPNSMR